MKNKKLLEDFKKFALKGNMIDLAIGVIIGSNFSALINSIVNDIIMPIVGWITGGIDFSNKFIQLSGQREPTLAAAKNVGATIAYGHFVTLFINFMIIAWILFLAVQGINAARKIGNKEEEKEENTNELPLNEKLLTEIRDILANENKIKEKEQI